MNAKSLFILFGLFLNFTAQAQQKAGIVTTSLSDFKAMTPSEQDEVMQKGHGAHSKACGDLNNQHTNPECQAAEKVLREMMKAHMDQAVSKLSEAEKNEPMTEAKLKKLEEQFDQQQAAYEKACLKYDEIAKSNQKIKTEECSKMADRVQENLMILDYKWITYGKVSNAGSEQRSTTIPISLYDFKQLRMSEQDEIMQNSHIDYSKKCGDKINDNSESATPECKLADKILGTMMKAHVDKALSKLSDAEKNAPFDENELKKFEAEIDKEQAVYEKACLKYDEVSKSNQKIKTEDCVNMADDLQEKLMVLTFKYAKRYKNSNSPTAKIASKTACDPAHFADKNECLRSCAATAKKQSSTNPKGLYECSLDQPKKQWFCNVPECTHDSPSKATWCPSEMVSATKEECEEKVLRIHGTLQYRRPFTSKSYACRSEGGKWIADQKQISGEKAKCIYKATQAAPAAFDEGAAGTQKAK